MADAADKVQVPAADDKPNVVKDAAGEEFIEEDVSVREQDRFLPIANISRIMKKVCTVRARTAQVAGSHESCWIKCES